MPLRRIRPLGREETLAAAAETEDESASTGTLRVSLVGRRIPNGTRTGAASNRVMAMATIGKGTYSRWRLARPGKGAARVVGEKENTPERVRVKERGE